jgi:hypothetical protein
LAVRNQLAVESNNDDDFVVYPNPASDTISFALPAKFTNGIGIYSILGQKYWSKVSRRKQQLFL